LTFSPSRKEALSPPHPPLSINTFPIKKNHREVPSETVDKALLILPISGAGFYFGRYKSTLQKNIPSPFFSPFS